MDSYLTTDDANPKAAAQSSRAQARPALRRRPRVERADDRVPRAEDRQGEGVARALGWLSIGVGLAEVVAPQGVARLIGIEADEENQRLLRGMGIREIASGLGILVRRRPTPWVWGRVAGDALDLALLGSAMRAENTHKGRAAVAIAAVLGVTALDVYCGTRLHQSADGATDTMIEVKKALTAGRSREERSRL